MLPLFVSQCEERMSADIRYSCPGFEPRSWVVSRWARRCDWNQDAFRRCGTGHRSPQARSDTVRPTDREPVSGGSGNGDVGLDLDAQHNAQSGTACREHFGLRLSERVRRGGTAMEARSGHVRSGDVYLRKAI